MNIFKKIINKIDGFVITSRMENATRELLETQCKPVVIIAVERVGGEVPTVRVIQLDDLTDAEMITIFESAIAGLKGITQIELEKALSKARKQNGNSWK